MGDEWQDNLSKWGVQTSVGLGAGFIIGFVKGYSESSHLVGKFGPNSVYHGAWASFRYRRARNAVDGSTF